ncbi:MAG: dTMP kinase [Deltaproteobacteria bacterium]|nr:dTMP kinase [Deltaproteobacteria bacterium]
MVHDEVRPRGTFVAIEGIDGAGTTTQADLLGERLARRGQSVHVTAEPSRGDVGRLLRSYLGRLDDPVDPHILALLFAADRLDHWYNEIEPALAQGNWVLSDRYLWSSLAYQSLDCPEEWVATINRYAPTPDVTVLIDVSPNEAEARRHRDGRRVEIFDELDRQRRVAEAYRRFVRESGDLGHCVFDVDGAERPEQVCDAVMAILEPRLASADERGGS